MNAAKTFRRRGIVEGFFGPLWSMAHRRRLFAFGAARGMNTYLYAPKDDPYHRKLWRQPYPKAKWPELRQLIRAAQRHQIDFVYGFHPARDCTLATTAPLPFSCAKRGAFTTLVCAPSPFCSTISRRGLSDPRDRRAFKNSLARAEGTWMAKIIAAQPASWSAVEWWICPSYYSEDVLLERVFGRFEPEFLETLAQYLPPTIACFWTGPSVVSKSITLAHVRRIAKKISDRCSCGTTIRS